MTSLSTSATYWDAQHAMNTWMLGASDPTEVLSLHGMNPRALRVLDIGIGTGEMSSKLCDLGNDVVGCDVSPVSLSKLDSRSRGILLDVLSEEQPFDVAIMHLVAQHLDDVELLYVLSNVRLTPTGILSVQWIDYECHQTFEYPMFSRSQDQMGHLFERSGKSMLSCLEVKSGCFGSDSGSRWRWLVGVAR